MGKLGVICCAFGLTAVGAPNVEARDGATHPPASALFEVEGRTMHMACVGEGERTFVLDAGASGWSVFWWRIQPRLAGAGRVCAFDRPGYGWSETTSGRHDGVSAADRLHALVREAGVATPFIYVGHSLGANFAEIYRSRYPDDVAGLVLLEPGVPSDMLEDSPPREEVMRAGECGFTCGLAGAIGRTGVVGLIAEGASFEGEARAQYLAGVRRGSFVGTVMREVGALARTAYQNLDASTLGDTPVLVFASTNPREPGDDKTPADYAQWLNGQRAYFAALAAKSSRSAGVVIVPDSTHVTMVLGEAPAAFVSERILAFAAEVGPPVESAPTPDQ